MFRSTRMIVVVLIQLLTARCTGCGRRLTHAAHVGSVTTTSTKLLDDGVSTSLDFDQCGSF